MNDTNVQTDPEFVQQVRAAVNNPRMAAILKGRSGFVLLATMAKAINPKHLGAYCPGADGVWEIYSEGWKVLIVAPVVGGRMTDTSTVITLAPGLTKGTVTALVNTLRGGTADPGNN